MPQNGNDTIRYPWWRIYPKLAAALSVVIIAVIAIAIYWFWPRTPEPVYVTNGSHVFNTNLAQVEAKIKAENDRVTAQRLPYVSIAVLDVMRPQPGSDVVNDASVRQTLEGAHIAQLTANQPVGRRRQAPQVRLLLGDEGSGESSWRALVKDLESRVGSPENLVAAAGLGVSTDNTRHLVDELSRHQIAMVGSVITADSFKRVQGMVRIAPTNSDEAQAAVKHLQRVNVLTAQSRILLVQDQNPRDTYAQSLGSAFSTSLGNPELMAPTFPYDSRLANVATVLSNHAERVCVADKANIVYFAGRGVDLLGLLNGLAGRSCRDTHLTVVTGDDASTLANQTLWQGEGANMTVLFTALAHPDMWTRNPLAASQTTSSEFGFCATCFRTLFPRDSLNNGVAIMSHDAVQTAVAAIRDMAGSNGSAPSTSGVAQELLQVSVSEASGYLCFDTDHNPINKAIPIMSYDQHGRPYYQALSSAKGVPPSDTCTSTQ
jgi:hypothetical protein